MAIKIVNPSDPIAVETLVVSIFGQPGIGKTSLACTADKPLVLDFDGNLHRAPNRKQAIRIRVWDELEEVLSSGLMAPFNTIVLDTVGVALEQLSRKIIEDNGKLGTFSGGLNQQGWGALKQKFSAFVSNLRAQQKDLVMVSHDREERDGEHKSVRPDIVGGSYGVVMRQADLSGYYFMGSGRILDFNPTERYIGKNPCGWSAMKVPTLEAKPRFLAGLLQEAKAHLNNLGAEGQAIAAAVDHWRAQIEAMATVEQVSAALPVIDAMDEMPKLQVKRLLWDRAKALGLTWDKAAKAFVAPPKPEPAPVEQETV